MTSKRSKLKFILMLCAVIAVILLAFVVLSGGNFQLLKSLFIEGRSSDELKAELDDIKVRGFVIVSILSALQVVMTFLPAEPAQVLAGVAFGFPLGLLCCLIGVFVGNSLIFLLCKLSGNRLREYFVKNLQFKMATHSSTLAWKLPWMEEPDRLQSMGS